MAPKNSKIALSNHFTKNFSFSLPLTLRKITHQELLLQGLVKPKEESNIEAALVALNDGYNLPVLNDATVSDSDKDVVALKYIKPVEETQNKDLIGLLLGAQGYLYNQHNQHYEISAFGTEPSTKGSFVSIIISEAIKRGDFHLLESLEIPPIRAAVMVWDTKLIESLINDGAKTVFILPYPGDYSGGVIKIDNRALSKLMN